FYQFQAVFAGVFHHQNWVKPNDRFVVAPLPADKAAWDTKVAAATARADQAQLEFSEWLSANRPRGRVIWSDNFDGPPEALAQRWSATAPDDDGPGGSPTVAINSDQPPGIRIHNGRLEVLAGGGSTRWVVTREKFDWTPND